MEGTEGKEGTGSRKYGGAQTDVFPRLGGFRNLLVWQRADDLAVEICNLTAGLGRGQYKLIDQMRAAATSVGANIAEGYARGIPGDYLRFCEIARGSLAELGSFLQYCTRTTATDPKQLGTAISLYAETSYLLNQLIRSLWDKRRAGDWERGTREHAAEYVLQPPTGDASRP